MAFILQLLFISFISILYLTFVFSFHFTWTQRYLSPAFLQTWRTHILFGMQCGRITKVVKRDPHITLFWSYPSPWYLGTLKRWYVWIIWVWSWLWCIYHFFLFILFPLTPRQGFTCLLDITCQGCVAITKKESKDDVGNWELTSNIVWLR